MCMNIIICYRGGYVFEGGALCTTSLKHGFIPKTVVGLFNELSYAIVYLCYNIAWFSFLCCTSSAVAFAHAVAVMVHYPPPPPLLLLLQ